MQQDNCLKYFVAWTKLKIKLHLTDKRLYFKEREIWWCSLGVNIGHEENGKHEFFERPVLMLKKFNREALWILPMSSQWKNTPYHYNSVYAGVRYSVRISQLRLVSSKRLSRRIRELPAVEFQKIVTQIKNLL